MLDITLEDLDLFNDKELIELENEVNRLLSVWQISNLRGNKAIFHDDQHIGENRRELQALKHPSVNVEDLMAFRNKPVVDSLAGNMLIHPLTTPIIEVSKDNTKARGVWWSLGIEALSKYKEKPMPIVSIGMVPGVHIKEDGKWKVLWGEWQRTTKNEYHASWIDNMIPTNTRPPLTPEQDRQMLGKYAYQKDEIRKAVPEPPRKDTWEQFPDETDKRWLTINLTK